MTATTMHPCVGAAFLECGLYRREVETTRAYLMARRPG
jgi:hypothetical protein